MRIGIIDADLIGRKRHRFPNLVCLKISGYYKDLGYEVHLLETYDDIDKYDQVYVSKVFTDTKVPEWLKDTDKIHLGGTGFYFDKAPNLPNEIEHHMPDYHLYDNFIEKQMKQNKYPKSEFKEYLDYSVGFTTRGCFRKCGFCVNQKYNNVFIHSPLEEFYDPARKKICLLDDNIFGCPKWREIFQELIATGKPFKFKQGLDERLLTDEKCEVLFNAKYDGEITFAFDKISDYELIHDKLKMIRRHTNKQITFYVLCGFDENNKYDDDFWRHDIINTFKRIELLLKYSCLPYIMRFNKYEDSPYRGMYINLARWSNQKSMIKKKSLKEFCYDLHPPTYACVKYLEKWINENKEYEYFTEMKFNKIDKT